MLNRLRTLTKSKKAFTLRSYTRKACLAGRQVCSEVGQSLSEYAIVLGVIVVALVSMQFFIRRRAQAIIYDNISVFGNPNYVEEVNPLIPGKTRTSEFQTQVNSISNRIGAETGAEQTILNESSQRRGTINAEEPVE